MVATHDANTLPGTVYKLFGSSSRAALEEFFLLSDSLIVGVCVRARASPPAINRLVAGHGIGLEDTKEYANSSRNLSLPWGRTSVRDVCSEFHLWVCSCKTALEVQLPPVDCSQELIKRAST